MTELIRLDLLLTNRGLAKSRTRAAQLIKEGRVTVNGKKADKPGLTVDCEAALEVGAAAEDALVSRGGLKLQKALSVFRPCTDGAVCADVGASTGGFTQCLLEAGAKKVYAIDVGCGQLAESLRADPRVVNLEKQNFRYFTADTLPEPCTLLTADVSFISLTLLLPSAAAVLRDGGEAVLLVKPQFEAGKEHIGKGGLVKDPAVHRQVLARVLGAARSVGLAPMGLDTSPVRGGDGNREYLLYCRKGAVASLPTGAEELVVAQSFAPEENV